MTEKDEIIDMIVTTPIEKIEGPDDVWESHIDLDDEKHWWLVIKEKEISVMNQMRNVWLPIPGTGNLEIQITGILYRKTVTVT